MSPDDERRSREETPFSCAWVAKETSGKGISTYKAVCSEEKTGAGQNVPKHRGTNAARHKGISCAARKRKLQSSKKAKREEKREKECAHTKNSHGSKRGGARTIVTCRPEHRRRSIR